MVRPDLIFFHPPSLYDFREHPEVFGPISDVIPSSPVFEMYPVGITSLAEYLERHGYHVQLINLAYRMLHSKSYDPERVIARKKSSYYAVDLHWLPHAQGSLEVARLIKKYHPEAPVIFGGLSSSYYHRELVKYPAVDYVLRGDSTEEPLLQLLDCLERGDSLEGVSNLTWRREGETVVNDLDFVPESIDYASLPAYHYVFNSVLKYRSLHNTLPYQEWMDYPTTMLLTARGCIYNCAICGGSSYSFCQVVGRKKPAFRSPERLLEDIRIIKSFSRAPIFVVHDLRQGGEEYASRFFDLLKGERIENEFIFELFDPAPEEYLRLINESVSRYSLQISLESHLERVRRGSKGKFAVSNEEFEETLVWALDHGCRKIDIFFMVGLSGQSYQDAMDAVDYCRQLLSRIGRGRIYPFIAPLAPFLDPGSPAFEDPDKYGYRKFCHTLEDHRQALLEPSWKQMLSYETRWMTRDEIVKATYDSALGMNELKCELGLIDEETYAMVKERILQSRAVLREIDEIYSLPTDQREEGLGQLQQRLEECGRYSICGRDELKWPQSRGLKNIFSLGALAMKLMWQNLRPSPIKGREKRLEQP